MKNKDTNLARSGWIPITTTLILLMVFYFSNDINAQPCSGIPQAGITVANPNPVCPGAFFNLMLVGASQQSGLTYQWYHSSDGITYVPFVGAIQQQFVTSELQPTFYTCRVKCTQSNQQAFSQPVLVTLIQPVITYPNATVVLNNGESTSPDNTGYVTFETTCCQGSVTYSDVTTSNCCRIVIARTWTIIDCFGEGTQYVQTITVLLDVSAPVITCATLAPGACNTTPSPDYTSVTVTDDCPVELTVTSADAAGTRPCEVVTTFTWTATDLCGHFASCTQTYSRIMDAVPPVITCPAPFALPCNTTPTPSPTLISATDNCGTPEISLLSSSSSVTGCLVTYVFTWRAIDNCGNFSDCNQILTSIHDAVAPVINCPGPTTLPCNTTPSPSPALITATDNCGTPSISLIGTSSSTVGCITTTVFTWRATDACGNFADCDQILTSVFDDIAPTIHCPDPVSLPCNTTPVISAAGISAQDNCGVPTLLNIGVTVTTVGCLKTFIFTWKATDDCGNFAVCDQIFTSVFDVIDPYIDCPEPVTLPCNTTPVPNPSLITVADNCGTPDLSLISTDISSIGCLRIFEFTWRATDDCGNFSECTQVYLSDFDLIPPVITCPEPDTLCNVTPTPSASLISATDNCGFVDITFVGATTSTAGCITTYNFTWKATDDCGNFSTCVQVIRVINDLIDPVINGCPNSQSIPNEEGLCGAYVSWIPPTATDNCGLLSFTSTHSPNSFFPVGNTTVTYTAIDMCGHVTICSFVISVYDWEPPWNIHCPGVIIKDNDVGLCSAVASWTITASDNCGVASIVSVPASGSVFPVGVTPVLTTVTDVNGNTWTCTFNVHVNDNEKPVFTNCPGDISRIAINGFCSAVIIWPEVIVTDNCALQSVVLTPNNFNIFPVGVTPVTYTATDIYGNVQNCKFNVTVIDAEPPVINGCPADIQVNNEPGFCKSKVTWVEPTAVDNCGILSFTHTFNSGDDFPVGQYLVTYTATDVNGNVTVCTFVVSVDDVEKPFILSHDIVTCDSVVTFNFTMGDNCMLDRFSYIPPSGSVFRPGTTTQVYVEAWDTHNNREFKYFDVTVLVPPSVIDSVKASNSEICLGDSVTITAYFDTLGTDGVVKLLDEFCNEFPLQYLWNEVNNVWTIKIKPDHAGIVTYQVRIEGYCDTTECKPVSISIINCPGVTLDLKVYIEGYYRSTTELMDNDGAGGCLYVIQEPGALFTDVDSVTVSAMESTFPFPEVDSQTSILQTDGSMSVTFNPPVSPGNSYYIRISHRSSLETWSKYPVLFFPLTTYDFTTSSSQAYDDGFNLPMKKVDTNPERWAIFNGDINGDGTADALDMTIEEEHSNAGDFGYYPSDLNGDGGSDALDMTIIENNSNLGIFEIHP